MMSRDIALIILAGVVVVAVATSATVLAATGTLAVGTAVATLTGLVAIAGTALGRLSGIGTSVVNNGTDATTELPAVEERV